ncbi:MAG TPA: hypothetical protein VEF35_10570 [Candidatus Bathyarchaeia archaeon]|nr:hypothetical protein [Candidatus Bathyarchaeia archaeon]
MNVSDISEDEIDEAVSEALHGISKAMDLFKKKKSFHQKVTDALFTILKRKDLTIFDVIIKRDEKVCEILDEPTKDVPEEKVLEVRSTPKRSRPATCCPRISTAILSCSMRTNAERTSR